MFNIEHERKTFPWPCLLFISLAFLKLRSPSTCPAWWSLQWCTINRNSLPTKSPQIKRVHWPIIKTSQTIITDFCHIHTDRSPSERALVKWSVNYVQSVLSNISKLKKMCSLKIASGFEESVTMCRVSLDTMPVLGKGSSRPRQRVLHWDGWSAPEVCPGFTNRGALRT